MGCVSSICPKHLREAHKLAREELEDEDYAKATLLEALGKVVRDNIHKPGVETSNSWSKLQRCMVRLRASMSCSAKAEPGVRTTCPTTRQSCYNW